MKPYLAEIIINLKLTLRDRMVLFFNYAFPLIFFFIFASLFRSEQGSAFSVQVVTMVLVIGILGNGFFGAGIRAAVEREANILRRFKVAPISAAPIIVSSLVTGWLNYLPSAFFIILLAHFAYGMAWPPRPLSLLVYFTLGVLAFRSLGMMVAAVVNSMQESTIITQLLYFPMLFLSGASIPINVMPVWLQVVTQFIPATYLFTGMQGIMVNNETLAQNWSGALALLTALIMGTFLGVKLFRWEKEEKIPVSGKLWLVVVLTPFLVLGSWQAYSRENLGKTRIFERQVRRGRNLLIRNARIFIGDGRVIESGSVLVRSGRIAAIYRGSPPDAKQLRAAVVEGAGKTLLPGLIDVHVHLASPGGVFDSPKDYDVAKNMPRELAAYLYSGVTAVKSAGDPLDQVLKTRELINSGERLGAELFVCGPMFTAPGGHGTEYTKYVPQAFRSQLEKQLVRLPAGVADARAQVDELKRRGVDGIKAILETGSAGQLFNRMDIGVLRAVSAEAHADKLPIVIHTGDARDVEDALNAGADGIEHGSFRELIPDELFVRMKNQNAGYDPTLTVAEALSDLSAGNEEPLDRPLVLQVGPSNLIQATRRLVAAEYGKSGYSMNLVTGRANLLRAAKAGVMLVTGTDSGNILLLHGPALHRELQLWVAAGIAPAIALRAATYDAARLLGADRRIGIIAPDHDANLLLVDGNPLEDIRRTESIQKIIFRGEQVERTELLSQE